MTQRKTALTLGVSAALLIGGAVAAPLASASETKAAADCSDVELVFARGTGDVPQPLGSIGRQLGPALTRDLPGKSVLATGVDYPATSDFTTSVKAGTVAMTSHIVDVAAQCADTQFVIGGYSQGALVTDVVVGATRWSGGQSLPTTLAPRIKAIVVFGNPISASGPPLEQISQLYGARTKSICGRDDTVCGGDVNGNVDGDHLSYIRNSAVIESTARFAADLIS